MSTKKVRVLVVDDSALMRKLIPQMLETDQSIEVQNNQLVIDGAEGRFERSLLLQRRI